MAIKEHDMLNSLATQVAANLITAGYLVYWHKQDAVQSTSGWWTEYSVNYATYLVDATFGPEINGAKGIVTIIDALPAVPRFIKRPITDGSAPEVDEVPIPALSIDVGAEVPISNSELGSKQKFRGRHLVVDGFARTRTEQATFADLFAQWFDGDTVISVFDHEGGNPNTLVDTVCLRHTTTDKDTQYAGAEAKTFEVITNSLIEYVA